MTIRLKLVLSLLILISFSTMTWADEAAVKKAIQEHFEGHKIDSLKKIPSLGLYEVVVGDELLYTDDKANYFSVIAAAGGRGDRTAGGPSAVPAVATALIYTMAYARDDDPDGVSRAKPLAVKLSGGGMLWAALCGLAPLALLAPVQIAWVAGLAVLVTVTAARHFRRRNRRLYRRLSGRGAAADRTGGVCRALPPPELIQAAETSAAHPG